MKAHIKTMYHDGEAEFVISHYVPRETTDLTALYLRDPETKEGILTVSSNLSAYGVTPKDQYHIWVKDYSENEGIFDELVSRGYIAPTGRKYSNGYVIWQEAQLIGDLAKLVEDYYSK